MRWVSADQVVSRVTEAEEDWEGAAVKKAPEREEILFFSRGTSKVCWVEGIGTASGLLANILTETSAQQILVKCRWLDEVFYEQNPDTLPFMVNVKTIPSETPRPLTPILHDLTGRRLTTPPAKGVYIENGVKRVK